MTSVSSLSQATTNDASAAASASLFSDYNMFLKLLTTQMTNQDPLDPLETSEYTQQLVQYSQVEQSIQQTGALNNILAQLNAQEMTRAAAYIGHEARFDSPVAGLGSEPARWNYYVEGAAASLTATITDSAGKVVHEVQLPSGSQGSYSWDGVKADGTKAYEGAYTLNLTALNASGNALTSTINSVAVVRDVVTDGANISLGVNGIRMPSSYLVALASVGS